jgi:glutaredoxin
MKYAILILSCLLPSLADAGALYRWVDDQGQVHYSDTPPPNKEQAERRKISNGVVPGEDIPYEARRAQENFPVTLYVSDTCKEPCTQARSFLRKRGIPYSETVLVTKTEIETFQGQSGSSEAPTLQVGKTYLGGFRESRWNSELDAAGYPKTATYRQLIAPLPEPNAPKSDAKPGAAAPTTEPAAQ